MGFVGWRQFPLGAYWDYDVAREQRAFHFDREARDEELPDVSSEREEWTPCNKPLGRIGRRNASTYLSAGD